jgi:hypothetical protein
MRLLLALALVTGMMPQAWACNPYMTIGSPFYNPAKFQMVFTPQAGGITRQDYDEIQAKFMAYYGPIVAARGGVLEFPDAWDDGMVNGFARQEDGKWKVFALGGYARHPLATRDSFYFLMCHEMGHHLGGTPTYPESSIPWAAAEGQADYYATLKCMRQMMIGEDNEAAVAQLNPPQFLRDSCARQFVNRLDQLLCIRGAMGGYAMTQIWEDGHGTFQFDTPSTDKVSSTSYWHPANQCRIDTYFQGSLCEVAANVDLSRTDASIGTCNHSTGQTIGLRPECWYVESTTTN